MEDTLCIWHCSLVVKSLYWSFEIRSMQCLLRLINIFFSDLLNNPKWCYLLSEVAMMLIRNSTRICRERFCKISAPWYLKIQMRLQKYFDTAVHWNLFTMYYSNDGQILYFAPFSVRFNSWKLVLNMWNKQEILNVFLDYRTWPLGGIWDKMLHKSMRSISQIYIVG